MSTRAWLGIRDMETGKVTAIYCHSNNYLEYRAPNLLEHWTDREKVLELISMGAASVVDKVIGRQHKFYRHFTPTSISRWDKEGWCLFYTRDRGDEFDQLTFESVPAYVEEFKSDDNCDIEYLYLFQADADGNWEWYVYWERDSYQERNYEDFAPEGLMRVSDAWEFKARLQARAEGYNEEADPAA